MENKTLMQIVDDRRALDELLTETGGEISEEQVEQTVSKWMAEIRSNLAVKADSYEYKQKDLEAMIEQFKAHAKMFSSAAKSLDRVSDALKDRMKHAMLEMDTKEIVGNIFKYKLSNSAPKVVILDETKIPATFCREKILVEVDKDAVKKAVLEGQEVGGVVLEQGYTLRVSANKGGAK